MKKRKKTFWFVCHTKSDGGPNQGPQFVDPCSQVLG